MTNASPIPGGAGVSATLSYTVEPAKVPGGGIDEQGQYTDDTYYNATFPITLTVADPNDPDNAEKQSSITKDLSLEMHTRVVTTALKEFGEIHYDYVWDTRLDPEPADADDYFYIEWKLTEDMQSTTNQPFSFTWSEENTVHDGTLVFITPGATEDVSNPSGAHTYDTYRVVMRYPLSLLEKANEYGMLPIHNEAIVTENWKSGYVTSHRVSADYNMVVPPYGKGPGPTKVAYNFGGTAPAYPAQKHGGQEDILDDGREVALEWRVEYSGGSDQTQIWDPVTETYDVGTREIVISEGLENNLFYSSGGADNKYFWNASTGDVPLTDEDYRISMIRVQCTEYDAVCTDYDPETGTGIWTGDKKHEATSDYSDFEVWVRHKDSDELSYLQNIGQGRALDLSQDVRGVQLRHRSSFYRTNIRLDIQIQLLPSEHVRSLLRGDTEQDTTSIIKNFARLQVYMLSDDGSGEETAYTDTRTGGTGSAYYQLWELDISDTTQFMLKTAGSKDNANHVRVDKEHAVQDHTMCLTGWLYNNSTPVPRTKPLKSGIFYDLLPRGTSVNPGTVYAVWTDQANLPAWGSVGGQGVPANNYDGYRTHQNRLPESAYRVSFEDNYNDSGRTMMTIKFAIPEGIQANGIHVFYLLSTTYEDIMDYGTSRENDAAFVNTTDSGILPGRTEASLDVIQKTPANPDIKAKECFAALEAQYSDIICFGEDSTDYEPIDIATWGFDKEVKAQGDKYTKKDTVLLGDTYSYWLAYAQGPGTKMKDVVFVDVLENGFCQDSEKLGEKELVPSEWNGTFVDIDISSLQNLTMEAEEGGTPKKCGPVVYYSTQDSE